MPMDFAFKVKAQQLNSEHATSNHDIDNPDDGVAGSECEATAQAGDDALLQRGVVTLIQDFCL